MTAFCPVESDGINELFESQQFGGTLSTIEGYFPKDSEDHSKRELRTT